MDITTFLYLATAEVLLVLTFTGIWLGWRRCSNQRRATVPLHPDTHPQQAGEQYQLLVQHQINKAEARLQNLLSHHSEDLDELSLIRFRMAYLKEEKLAVEACGDNEQALWQMLRTTLPALMPATDVPDQGDGNDNDPDLIDPEDYRLLQRKLHASEKRADSLTKFKELFFSLKDQFNESQKINTALHEELEELLPTDFASEDIQAVLAKLREENNTLHHQLEDVESSFAKLTRNLDNSTPAGLPLQTSGQPHSIGATSQAVTAGVAQIKSVMDKQDEKIQQLNTVISSLKLQVEQQQALEQKLAEYQNVTDELRTSISQLEEENNFMCEQISALLKQELETDKQHKQASLELEEALTEQQLAVTEMEARYAKLESDYQQLYAEHQALKGG